MGGDGDGEEPIGLWKLFSGKVNVDEEGKGEGEEERAK